MTESKAPSGVAARWGKRLGLLLFSLLLTLAMLETLGRLLHLGSGGFWEPNKLYGWKNIPGARGWESCYGDCEVFVEMNSRGLRDYEYSYEKDPGVRRILFLGDSMTAGLQVPLDDTFVKILERGLEAERHGQQVINAAVNAFGTDNELIFYQEEAAKYHPDVVVLSIYLANDIYNNHYQLETTLGGSGHKPYFTLDGAGALVRHNFPVQTAETPITHFVGFLNRHFQLPRFIAQTMNLRRNVPDALKPLIALATGSRGAQEAVAQAEEQGQAPEKDAGPRVDICEDEYAPVIAEAWDITKAIIRQLRADVEASGGRLIVLALPAAPQIILPGEGKDWYCNQPNVELDSFLEAQGILYLDLLDAFRQKAQVGDGEPLFFETDFHMTRAGHALAGAELVRFFSSLTLQ